MLIYSKAANITIQGDPKNCEINVAVVLPSYLRNVAKDYII